MDDNIADYTVKLLINIFQKQGKVTESGLIAFSGLCNGIGARINIKEFGTYIAHALKGTDDECTRLACGLISDLATAMGDAIGEYMLDFVPCLLTILKNNDQDRNTKLQAIVALGDLAMNSPSTFISSYLEDVLKILSSAANLSLSTQQFLDDEDMLDYLQRLRDSLIECYTTIVHGVKQSAYTRPLIQNTPTIFKFLEEASTNKVHNPTMVTTHCFLTSS